MKSVWIVDDDQSIRWVFEKALAREKISFQVFSSVAEVERQLGKSTPTVIVSDIRMSGTSGIDLLKKIKQQHPKLPVIIMTAYSDLESAVAAFHGGAFDYLSKPFDVEKALDLIRRILNSAEVEGKSESRIAELTTGILGQAAAIQEVFRVIGRLSGSNATVLINGESGTGKELVARALHEHSPRSGGPFIAINTAAIPKELLESELFGHERGAFTGAQAARQGRFEQAEHGSLFLDEIGDMPADSQTRLLRVLSDGEFYRVGGYQPLKANVRIIAATHQDLDERVKQGIFREDLFHRLNVIQIRLPALRERREDIPLLTRFFLQKSAKELKVNAKRISDKALKFLSTLDFPGNVRQLENLCHWLTVMAPSAEVDLGDLPAELLRASCTNEERDWMGALAGALGKEFRRGGTGVMGEYVKQFEKTLISKALQFTGGRRMEAATLLGLGRNTLTRKIQELNLDGDTTPETPDVEMLITPKQH